jgi:hypothetical protein
VDPFGEVVTWAVGLFKRDRELMIVFDDVVPELTREPVTEPLAWPTVVAEAAEWACPVVVAEALVPERAAWTAADRLATMNSAFWKASGVATAWVVGFVEKAGEFDAVEDIRGAAVIIGAWVEEVGATVAVGVAVALGTLIPVEPIPMKRSSSGNP